MDNIQKIGLKCVRIQQQLFYLKQAADQGFLPRGIGEQCKFTSSIHDVTLQTVCQSIMNMAGSSILDIMIIYYANWHKRL